METQKWLVWCLALVLAACQTDLTTADTALDPEKTTSAVAGALQVGPDMDPASPIELPLMDGQLADVLVTLREDLDDAPDDAALQARVTASQARVLAALSGDPARVLRRYRLVPALALRVGKDALARLLVLPEVEHVTADRMLRTDALPATVVQATAAHAKLGLWGTGVRIAVIDSGVDLMHPDLVGRVAAQRCFDHSGRPGSGKTVGASAQDQHGHGTHVASLLVGAGKVAPQGIAPGSKLVAVRVFGKGGSGPTSDVLAGLDWVAQNAKSLGVRVVNLSLGGEETFWGTCDKADPATAKAVKLLRSKGVAVFAAAGNAAKSNSLSSPACLTGVISVGATYTASYGPQSFGGLCSDKLTGTARMACFSNRSAALDLVAPGAFLTGAGLGGGAVVVAGTSQATPVAAGIGALLMGCKPALTPDALQAALQKSAKPLADPVSGRVYPLVQAVAAAALVCP
jgi:subtilisin family serine protease